jgi:hypothetical protein
MQAYSDSRQRLNIDLLTEACQRFKREGRRGIDWVFDHMSSRERLAFDLWLVEVGDQLAWEPGTTEYRFHARVLAMVLAMVRNTLEAEALAAAQEGRETDEN